MALQAGNILDGPGQHSVDIGIFRTFRVKERMGLEFRAESTNAFNLVSLANSGLTSNLNSNLFGTVRQADAMRQVYPTTANKRERVDTKFAKQGDRLGESIEANGWLPGLNSN